MMIKESKDHYVGICFDSVKPVLIKMFLTERLGRNKKNNNNKYSREKKRKKTNKIVQHKHSSDNKKSNTHVR